MSRPRSRLADYAVYLIVRVVVCLIQTVSFERAWSLADYLAWFVYRVDRRHREVALENLQSAFPNSFTDLERDALVRSVYAHFCRLLIEIIHLPRRLHINNWQRFLDFAQAKPMVEVLLSDRPLMIVTGHFGNWEMAGYALGLLGFKTYAVARPLDNPYLDDLLLRFRQRTGQKVLAKKGDFAQMRDILANKGVLTTLADQDAGQRGLFVEFFGRPASTHKAIALLALEHGVTLAVAMVRNTGQPMSYCVHVEDVIRSEEYVQRPDVVRAITQRFTAALERGIRAAPHQYFWLHRRWKHQPSKPKRRAA
jgi:KDO2-lipid IV(A) lauroyltransferase